MAMAFPQEHGTLGPPEPLLRMDTSPDQSSSSDSDHNTDMEAPDKEQSSYNKNQSQPSTRPKARYFPIGDRSSPDPLADSDWTPPLQQAAARSQQAGLNRSNHASLTNSIISRKRPTGTRNMTPEPPRPAPTLNTTQEIPSLNDFSFTSQRLAALTPKASNAEEAIAIARNMVLQASSLVSCTKKQM
jgi:hypothetical protein